MIKAHVPFKEESSVRMSFDELRSTLRETDNGKLVDSLIAVEMGLVDYATMWEAHQDILEAHPDARFGHPDNSLISFLVDMSDWLDFEQVDFDKLLKSTSDT